MKEIDEIRKELESGLAALDQEENMLKRLASARGKAREAIEKMEGFFIMRNEFNDDPDGLINFNRNLAPPFYAKFVFFSKVWAFECLKANTDSEEYEELYKHELTGIKRFFQQHSEFRRYYLSGATGHDALFFQNFIHIPIYLDELVVGISPTVNKGCLLVAYIQAFKEYSSYLRTPVQKEQTELSIDPVLYWTGKQSDLVELAISLEGYINKGNKLATQREIIQAFSNLFHVDLSNSAVLDHKRRNRLHDEPGFLEGLAEKSNKRKNELSENQKTRKRRG
jgi:hypothetical protein